MLKKIFLIGAVISIFATSCNLFAQIKTDLPLKKPISTKEEIKKKSKNSILKPLKKPSINRQISNEKIIKTETKEIKFNFKIPKKKPITKSIVKNTNIKISKYYSKKDFSLAKKAISEMEKRKWKSA